MYKCMECGCIFEEEDAGSRWSELGDSLPPGIKLMTCPWCGDTAIEDYYEEDEDERDVFIGRDDDV